MTGSLHPLGEALGTEARGIDLAKLDDETFDWVRKAFAEHPVLVFRNQHLTAEELAAFGRRFGAPRIHSLVKYRYPGVPEVSWLRNVDDDGKIDWYGVKRATDWHTDSTYEENPPLLAMLHALEVPSSKGGTMFADMRAAYDTLPSVMKDRLSALTGLHGRTDGPAGARLYDPAEEMRMTDKAFPEKQRPAVIRHPVSGRQILFVNPMHVHGFSRDGEGRGLGADRRIGPPRDAGTVHLLSFVAGRRSVDVGRAGDDAPRRRRFSSGGTAGDDADDCLPELNRLPEPSRLLKPSARAT